MFASLSEKPRLKPESVDQPDKYNIDIFILDSTARNQFFRHMPLMLQFMRRLDFKFLHGHTKVPLFVIENQVKYAYRLEIIRPSICSHYWPVKRTI